MTDKLIVIYVTASSAGEAEKISQELLKQRLIACSNIVPDMQSYFVWKNKFSKEKECILLLKTLSNKFNQIEKIIAKIHSYENPCIYSLPVDQFALNYLSWVKEQVTGG